MENSARKATPRRASGATKKRWTRGPRNHHHDPSLTPVGRAAGGPGRSTSRSLRPSVPTGSPDEALCMKTAVTIAVLAVLLLASLVAGLYLWWSLGEVDIGLHGFIALTLGCVLSLALGGGLMFLVFYSNRRGHDDEHHRGPPI